MFFNICSWRIANPYNTEGWDDISQPTGISLPIFYEGYIRKDRGDGHIRKDGI